MKKRLLPEHVSCFRDRHGKLRHRYRRTGHPGGYFTAELGTVEFLEELAAFKSAAAPVPAERAAPGTIDDLCTRYYRSQDFNDQGETSRRKNRAVIESFRAGRGHRRVADVTWEHIDAILAKKGRKSVDKKGRPVGGKAAAQRLRKQIRRLFKHAVKVKMRRDNPVELTARVKYKTDGFHTWTEEEIAQYQARHPLGTKARLALEIMLWTGQRRGDARTFGPGQVKAGRMRYTQQKTGKELWLPLAPQLADAIKAMPSVGLKAYLVTEAGAPFTDAGFGNWFREQCDAAELPHCTAHGLRKAIGRRMAENDASQKGIKAVGGWSNDRDVAIYTAKADQGRLADKTLGDLIAWDLAKDETR